MCLSRYLSLRSPVLRTGILTVRPLRQTSLSFIFQSMTHVNVILLYITIIIERNSTSGILFGFTLFIKVRLAGSDGSMSASGSAGPGFDPRRGSKFSFENFQPQS